MMSVAGASAQEAPPASRTELLERLRDAKEKQIREYAVSKVENAFNRFGSVQFLQKLEGKTGGFRPVIGGQQTGSGFSAGVGWRPPNSSRKPYTVWAEANLSARQWQRHEAGLALPRLADGRLSVELTVFYQDANSLSYFGPGPKSRGDNRTNFRLEETRFQGAVRYRPVQRVMVGAFSGYSFINEGAGQDIRYASSDRQFAGMDIPGLQQQSDFLRTGLEALYDWRDNPKGPRSGGHYLARWAWLDDRTREIYNFRRLDLEATQYVPFFNERRVLAFRAASTMMFTRAGQRVPFYMQSTVGGSDDLRGFRAYRFYGDNSAVINAEYRWEIFSGLDGAFFFDAGQVFDRRRDFQFNAFESSWGFGLRGNVQNVPVIRVDVGFSREGFRIWLKFRNFM